MSSDKIVLFRRFQFEADAREFALILQDDGIRSKIVDNSPAIDITFTNSTPSRNQFEVFIRKSEFLAAERILLDQAEKQSNDIPSDHYLLEFSDEELIQLLIEKDKWHELDQVFARKILEKKGTLPKESFFQEQEKLRIAALSQKEKFPFGVVIWGYFSALGSLVSILPSPFAILVSCYILLAKKVLPNG